MKMVILPSGDRHTFAYDPKGKRIESESPTDVTKFTWDLENVLAEFNNGGSTNRVYTHEPAQYGNLLSHKTSTDNLYYHFDALGSTRLTSNASAVASPPFIYAAFGDTITAPTNPGTPYQWVGQLGYQSDPEIMLNYIRARFYDPGNGMWMSEDPLGMLESMGLQNEANLLRYVMNNPAMLTDPSGLWVGAGLGCAVAGGLSAVWSYAAGDKITFAACKAVVACVIGGLFGALATVIPNPNICILGLINSLAKTIGNFICEAANCIPHKSLLCTIIGLVMSAIMSCWSGVIGEDASAAIMGAVMGFIGEFGGNEMGGICELGVTWFQAVAGA